MICTALSVGMLLGGCRQQKSAKTNETATDTVAAKQADEATVANDADAQAVKARVETIFADIANLYNGAQDEDAQAGEPIARRYCSDEWNALEDEVERVDAKHPGDLGFWEYDVWVQGQDWDKVLYKNIDVLSLDGNTARVSLVVVNGEEHPIEVKMVRERNDWYIDDLTDASNPNGVKRAQVEYVKVDIARQR